MKLQVIGCSGRLAGPESPAPCYVVSAEHEPHVACRARLRQRGARGDAAPPGPRDLDAVVLTHLHPDHCLDLCGLKVMRCYDPRGLPDHPLPVHAPAGASARMARAYGVDAPEPLEPCLEFHPLSAREPVEIGPFRITPIPVLHPVEAYGLRVEADGAVLAYTGDTDLCDALSELCVDADLVLADCAYVDGRDDDKVGVHIERVARGPGRGAGHGRAAPSADPPARVERPRRVSGPGRRRSGRGSSSSPNRARSTTCSRDAGRARREYSGVIPGGPCGVRAGR